LKILLQLLENFIFWSIYKINIVLYTNQIKFSYYAMSVVEPQKPKGHLSADKILKTINKINNWYLYQHKTHELFQLIINEICKLTGSIDGVFAEVKYGLHPLPTIIARGISEESLKGKFAKYAKSIVVGIELKHESGKMFQNIIKNKLYVMSNDVENDDRFNLSKMPEDHPKIKRYLGLPLWQKAPSKKIIGIIYVANRKKKYKRSIVKELEPLITLCSMIVLNHQNRNNLLFKKSMLNLSNPFVIWNLSVDQSVKLSPAIMRRLTYVQANKSFIELTDLDAMTSQSDTLENLFMRQLDNKKLINAYYNCIINEEDIHLPEVKYWLSNESDELYSIKIFSISPGCIGVIGESLTSLIKIKQLSEESNIKSQFLANMSHEIRTPLGGIITILQLFNETELSEEQLDYMEIMQQSGKDLMQIVNAVLDVAKLEDNKVKVTNHTFSIRDILDSSIQIVIGDASKNNLEISINVAPDVPSNIIADDDKLKQILVNLLRNAIKFSKDSTINILVELDTEEHFMHELLVNKDSPKHDSGSSDNSMGSLSGSGDSNIYRTDKSVIKFSIIDKGIGIREIDLNKLFKMFSQVDQSNTKAVKGTGLGLYLCKGYVELMGGNISVMSEYNKGSTFSFTVEAIKSSDTDIYKQFSELVKGKRVLVVDDKYTNRIAITGMLNKWDIDFSTCPSAQEALLMYFKSNDDKNKFDLGLFDIQMPNMDGNSLVDKIRERGYSFPVIALSSLGSTATISSNFVASINKPPREKKLFTTIVEILDGDISKPIISKLMCDYPNIPILVAEDNEANQKVVKKLFERIGCNNYTIVNDGIPAMESIKNNEYALIILDIKMLNMHGAETSIAMKDYYEKIRKPRPYMVAFSACAIPEEIEKIKRTGCFDNYITKPVMDFDVFTHVLNTAGKLYIVT
jgi:signal transduction histidine kinase/CheY-like chemotaxis protein